MKLVDFEQILFFCLKFFNVWLLGDVADKYIDNFD